MAMVTGTITIRFAWWLWPYVNTLNLVAAMTGMEPDIDKVARVIKRAMRVEFGPT